MGVDTEWQVLSGDLHLNPQYFGEAETGSGVHSTFLLSPPDGPILQAKPKPVSVDVGKDASFSCAWRGNPLPRITWTRLGGSQVKAELELVTVARSGPRFLADSRLRRPFPVLGAELRAHAASAVSGAGGRRRLCVQG